MDDRELVESCLRGERDAWRRMVREHDWKISKVLWRMGARRELDDLRQEVWARLLARDAAALRRFRGEHEGSLRVFLGTVARTTALDHFRGQRPPPFPLEDAAAPSPEDALVDEQRRALVSRALEAAVAEAEHPARDRDIARLHFLDGLSAAEIAATGLGLSARGVEAVLRRIRARLQQILRDEKP